MGRITKVTFEQLKQILQQDGNEGKCPVWTGFRAGTVQTGDVTAPKRFWSPRAGGVFTIPAGIPLHHIDIPEEETRKRVSTWIWERNIAFDEIEEEDEAELPELTPSIIRQIAGLPPLTTEQRIDRALRAIGRPPNRLRSKSSGSQPRPEQIETLQRFQAATECGDDDEMSWLIRELVANGLISEVNPGAVGGPSYSLTFNGLNRLEAGGNALVSNTAFVAMWFNDQQMKDALEKGIAPAISEAGYKPLPINWKEHSNKICDEIIAEIRRARFLVCDFTCGLLPDRTAKSGETAVARGGVYYEAGFAHGLGKKVIWTCRSDLIDHVHFDLRQYNTILWEEGKEDEFRQALLNRIRAEIT
ncbi:MAG: hypothetical protein OXI87_00885 [Albidovulum sp.]|nr:hypothetical protein [Albidovulum sp.]